MSDNQNKQRSRWHRFSAWAMAVVAVAVISASVTTDRVDWVGHSVRGLFASDNEPQRSIAARVTDYLYREVQTGAMWDDEPTMYPESRQFIVDRFSTFDPRRPHRLLLPRAPVVPVAGLVRDLPVFIAQRITLVGKVRAINIATLSPSLSHLRPPGSQKKVAVGNVTYVAQIGPSKSARPLVYCLFTEALIRRLVPGQWVAAIGIPIAGGIFKLVNGGFTPGVYMLAATVQPVKSPKAVLRAVRMIARHDRRQAKS